MFLNVLCIGVALFTAYIWLTRGFFSALIHLLATIIAGAIAFAAWEPLSMWLLDGASPTGFVASSAWAIGLLAPFGVALAVIRPVLDRIIRANVRVHPTVDYLGGGVLGLAAGAISAGFLAMGLSYLRVDNVGARSFTSGGTGNVDRDEALWVPFDKATVGFYAMLSEHAFRTDETLARWRPAAYDQGNANRLSAFDGSDRNTFRPGDAEVKGRFTVGSPTSTFSSLTTDMWNSNPQTVNDPSGETFPPGTHIEGVLVNFTAGAKEKDGQSAVGNAQVQMLLENDQGDRKMVFPFAVSSQADPRVPGVARWRYDAANVFIASIGGTSDSLFAFEFPCPPGYHPYALYVKGIRTRLDEGSLAKPVREFASAAERDAGLAALGMGDLASVGAGPDAGVDERGVRVIGDGRNTKGALPPTISTSIRLPWNVTIQLGSHGQLELQDEGTKNIITGGEATINKSEMSRVIEKNIQVQNFLADPSTVLVQMEVGPSSRTSLLGGSVDAAENVLPPVLVDTLGETYQPIGYVYQDETVFKVSFKPGEPIRAMSQLPSLSRSRPSQQMVLLFRVNLGREVKEFRKGNVTVYEFNPPFKLDTPQQNR